MSIEEKKYMVEEVAERFKKSQSIFVAEFKGLKAIDLDELRGKLEEAASNYFVVKNTLALRALEKMKLKGLTDLIDGPTSFTLVEDDPVKPAKVLVDFAKAHEGFNVRGGYVAGQIVLVEGIKKIASLPSREVLLAKVVGGINAPISGFVFVLSGLLRGFVCALNQLKDKVASHQKEKSQEQPQDQGKESQQETPQVEEKQSEEKKIENSQEEQKQDENLKPQQEQDTSSQDEKEEEKK